MNIYRQFAILILLFVTPLSLLAHGYWLDIKGDGKINHKVKIEVCYGEIDVYGNRLREAGAYNTQVVFNYPSWIQMV